VNNLKGPVTTRIAGLTCRQLFGQQSRRRTGSLSEVGERGDETGRESDDKETVDDLEKPEAGEQADFDVAANEEGVSRPSTKAR
jgi:hypothetical protein